MTGKLIRGMPMAEYQAIKALSAGGVHALVEECPAVFWRDSPWNPKRKREDALHYDIGTGLHLAVLEGHEFSERVALVSADDYKTKVARQERDDAYIAGKTPLRPKDLAEVQEMARAIQARPDIAELFTNGDAEVTLLWDWGGIPCKARADYLSAAIVDLKSAESANPYTVRRKAYSEGWASRAAWYMEGAIACGLGPKRYLYVVVEKASPPIVEVFELSDRALAWGRQIVHAGLRRFQACLGAGRWPSYGRGRTIEIELPEWAEYRLADKEAAGELDARYLDA